MRAKQNSDEPLMSPAEVQAFLGVSRATRKRMEKQGTLRAVYPVENGHGRFVPGEVRRLATVLRDKRHQDWKAACALEGRGVYEMPQDIIAADVNGDIRSILRTGREPEGHAKWRNGVRLGGDAPADLVAALGLSPGAPWARVVDKVEQLLALPQDKQSTALGFIAKRQAEFFDNATDPLADEDLS